MIENKLIIIMTTFGEINKKLSERLYLHYDYLADVDIGDYTFTNVEKIGEFIYKYTNEKNPNTVLIFNDDRQAIQLYELIGDKVKITVWRRGKNYAKTFPKKEIGNLFNNG